MKLAIELTSGTEAEDARTVRCIAEAALRQGHQVAIFLMDDGVYNVQQLRGLVAEGARVAVCAHNCLERGIAKVEGILWGGQNDWGDMVHDADRVMAFG